MYIKNMDKKRKKLLVMITTYYLISFSTLEIIIAILSKSKITFIIYLMGLILGIVMAILIKNKKPEQLFRK